MRFGEGVEAIPIHPSDALGIRDTRIHEFTTHSTGELATNYLTLVCDI